MRNRIQLVQGSMEWHLFRKKHIGASDAPIIMGVSPWKTPFQLYHEKISDTIDLFDTDSMKRGRRLEPVALALFHEKSGIMAEPAVMVHPCFEWMSASLDGLSPLGQCFVEIKCPGREDHELALQRIIPDKYYPQIQHQFLVTGIQHAWYCSYNPDHSTPFTFFDVEPDPIYIKMLVDRCEDFWDCVTTFTPPPLCDRDFVSMDSCEEWEDAAEVYKGLCEHQRVIEQQLETAKKNFVRLSNGMNAKGCGVSSIKITRKGSVNYESIPEIKDIDLEKYRKDPTEYWKVAIEKSK